MATATSHRKYISRIASTIRQILILQSLQVLLFISVINYKFLSPIIWITTIIDKLTSGICWLCYILNAVLLFGLAVRYSKNYTMKYSLITSRFEKILKLFTANSQILVLSSILFGFANAYFHLKLTGSSEMKDDDFLNSLLEQKSLIICSGPYFALHYLIRHNFKDEIIQLPTIHQSVRMQLASKMKILIYESAKLTLHSIPLYFILYSVLGYKALEIWSILFDVEDNFNIFECLNKNVIIYLFTFGTCFHFMLLIIHELFKLNLMQPMEFPIDKENNSENEILLSDALKSENPLIKMLAFQDLYFLTERNPARRQEIFSITFPGGQGKNWTEISSECKSVLEKFIDGLLKTYPKLTSSKKSIDFGSSRNRANLDHLMSSASFRAYPKEVLNNKEETEKKSSIKEYITKKIVNNPCFKFMFGDKDLLHFKQVIADSQIIVWVNISLTTLLKMSLVEDKYGLTQSDVPQIIELMVKLQDTLTTLNKMSIYKVLSKDEDLYVTLITSLEINIKSCIYMLNYIYKPYFAKMQLENDIKEKLSYYSV